MSGFFSAKEKAAIEQFRVAIGDLKLSEIQRAEHHLIRWLRARDLDIPKATEMLTKSLEWRKENEIDTINSWKPTEEIAKQFPYEIWGFDKEFCPVGLVPFGKWDIKKACESGEKDTYIKYVNKMIETVLTCIDKMSVEMGKPVSQVTLVFDMAGLSLGQITSIDAIDAMLQNVKSFEANYPETLKHAFVINAPRIYSVLFNLIKPLLNGKTLSKVKIFNNNAEKYLPTLTKTIPIDRFPVAYGGTNTNVLKDLTPLFDKKITEIWEIDLENKENLINSSVDESDVGAADVLKLDFEIEEANSKLKWDFSTEAHDIGFSVVLNGTEVVPYKRMNADIGEFVCRNPGKYSLTFDNTFSRFRKKTISYGVNVISPCR